VKKLRSILLLFAFPPDFAGGGLQASRLMDQLGTLDVDMRVLTARPESGAGARRERAFGGEVIRFRVFGGAWGRDLMLSLRAGWWLLVHSGWDLLHISGFSYFGVLPVLVAKLKGKPVLIKTTVLGRNGAFNPGISWPARKALGTYARADVFVALSQALADDLLGQERVTGRVLQIPNGVDTDLFRPAREGEREQARDSFGLPRDATVIVTCCKIYPRKNVVSLVRAAGRMKERPVCVVMAGPPGSDSAYLEELDAAIAALPQGVEARRIGSLASRAEGLPNALLEGMASGLACVATEIPGAADVLADGGGVLVPLDDDERLAEALDRLAGDPDLRRRLGGEARNLIEDRYTFSAIAARYREVYDSMLGSGG
jgi:glycosyltransferase involved in cell wall biosynthesis